LNVDAFPEPDWLERLLAAAKLRPDGALFGSRMIQALDPERLDGVGDAYHVSGVPWCLGHGQNVRDSVAHDAEVFSVCGAAMLCRRDLFLEAGGFDESFFCYAEDVDLGFRLILLGTDVGTLLIPRSTTSVRRPQVNAAISRCTTGTAIWCGCISRTCPGPFCGSIFRSTFFSTSFH